MKLCRPTCVAVALVALVSTAGIAAAETERVQKTVPLAPGGTLELHNFSGRVTIVPTDRPEVVVDAVRTAPRERLNRIKLDIQASGSTVRIDANKKIESSWFRSDVVETELNVQVPRQTNLQINVFSSPVKVTGITGDHRIHSFSATVQLTDVNGPVKATTFSGDIDLQLNAADNRPRLDLHTFSGDIDVRMPAAARADVDFSSFSGDLTSDLPLMLRSKSRRSVHGELNAGTEGSGPSNIYMKTFSGDARIRR